MNVLITPTAKVPIDNEATPFPTVGELVRYIARAFDIKNTNKKLDTFAQDVDFNWLNEGEVIDEGIFEPLKQHVGAPFSEWLIPHIKKILVTYKNLVLAANVDALKREDVMPILINELFVTQVSAILKSAEERFNFPCTQLLTTENRTTFSLVLKSLSEDQDLIQTLGRVYADDFSKTLNGSDRRTNKHEQFNDWLEGTNIPDLSSLKLLTKTIVIKLPKTNPHIMQCLTIARAIDWLFAEINKHNFKLDSTRHKMLGDRLDIELSLEKLNLEKSPVTENIKPALDTSFQKFYFYKTPKLAGNLEVYRNVLITFQSTISSVKDLSCGQYMLDLFCARFNIMQGQPETALQFYESSFMRSLYRAGKTQKDILAELLATAAYLADKACLKKHKAWGLAFNIYPKNKFPLEVIESWEIKELKNYFYERFPRECLFAEVGDYYQHPNRILGMDVVYTQDLEDQPLNLRSPNKKTTFAGKFAPPLVVEAAVGNVDNIKNLLVNGADVNKIDFESGGGSALLNALVQANKTYSMIDIVSVVELLKYPHESETLNRLTNRNRHSILFEAIKLGKPDIVKTILDMGADPNLRAEIDNQSPLDLCIQQLHALTSKSFWKNLRNQKVNQEDLARITGQFASHMFDGENQQISLKSKMEKNPEMGNDLLDLLDKDHRKKHTESSLYEITHLLLINNANPNSGNLKNYAVTPLMFAAEIRHKPIFELLVKYRGDVHQPNS